MAFAIIQLKEQEFKTRPAYIQVWIALMIQEIDQLSNPSVWLLEARNDWHTTIHLPYDGWTIQLEEHLTNLEQIKLVLKLANSALNKLQSKGDMLSMEWLNSLDSSYPGSYFVGDVESQKFIQVGREFIKFLEIESQQ